MPLKTSQKTKRSMFVKTLAIKKELALDLLKFATLVAIICVAPLIGHQAITGSIVNAVLFVATVVLGYRNAILLGIFPSIIALLSGTLSTSLAPMIPFIISGNAMLILIFETLRKKNYWLAVASAGFCKFIFLWGASSFVFNLILPGKIAKGLSIAMGYPQLLTALAGGVIAYIFLKFTNRK